jgi:D-serine deaminase-like pyridoxal phosphate-dependent protein
LDQEDIPTPALLIDLPIAKHNIERMASYARKQGLELRPHTKTHKSLLMAELQLQSGARGLTVAKVGEAEAMSELAEDLLVAYPAVDPARTRRVAALAQQRTVRVAVDSDEACDAIASVASAVGSTVGILVDVDVGFHRTGVQDAQSALRLARKIEKTSRLRLDGLFCFPGHIRGSEEEQAGPLDEVSGRLGEVIDLWRSHGLDTGIVSGGSTPTAYHSHLVSVLTEIRPGTYVYNDRNCLAGGYCEIEDCAAQVVTTVVSNAVPGKVVVDAGTKSLTSDRNAYLLDGGYGFIAEYPEARVVRLSEEHGEMDVSGCQGRPAIGERVHIIPNHVCPVVNLHQYFWLGRANGSYEKVAVDSRGMVS